MINETYTCEICSAVVSDRELVLGFQGSGSTTRVTTAHDGYRHLCLSCLDKANAMLVRIKEHKERITNAEANAESVSATRE